MLLTAESSLQPLKIHVENTNTIHGTLPLHLLPFLFTLIIQHGSLGHTSCCDDTSWGHIQGPPRRYLLGMFLDQKTFGSFALKSCVPNLSIHLGSSPTMVLCP